jgi:hypothetical protein
MGALLSEGGFVTGARINLAGNRAFCLTAAADEAAVRQRTTRSGSRTTRSPSARVTGMDLRGHAPQARLIHMTDKVRGNVGPS